MSVIFPEKINPPPSDPQNLYWLKGKATKAMKIIKLEAELKDTLKATVLSTQAEQCLISFIGLWTHSNSQSPGLGTQTLYGHDSAHLEIRSTEKAHKCVSEASSQSFETSC